MQLVLAFFIRCHRNISKTNVKRANDKKIVKKSKKN